MSTELGKAVVPQEKQQEHSPSAGSSQQGSDVRRPDVSQRISLEALLACFRSYNDNDDDDYEYGTVHVY